METDAGTEETREEIGMNWYKVTFSNQDVADRKHMALQNAFINILMTSGRPRGAGMYQSTEFGVSEYFFSPAAAQIALPTILSYAGVECAAPMRSSVKPSVADKDEDVPFSPSPLT